MTAPTFNFFAHEEYAESPMSALSVALEVLEPFRENDTDSLPPMAAEAVSTALTTCFAMTYQDPDFRGVAEDPTVLTVTTLLAALLNAGLATGAKAALGLSTLISAYVAAFRRTAADIDARIEELELALVEAEAI